MEAPAVLEKVRTRPASCGAIVVSPDGKILLMLRDKETEGHKFPDPDRWGILGGKMELGEEPIDALVREIREEAQTNIETGQVEILGQLQAGPDQDHDKHIAIVRLTREQADNVRLGNEGQELRFFGPDELKNLDLVPDLKELLLSHLEAVKKITSGNPVTPADLGLVRPGL